MTSKAQTQYDIDNIDIVDISRYFWYIDPPLTGMNSCHACTRSPLWTHECVTLQQIPYSAGNALQSNIRHVPAEYDS